MKRPRPRMGFRSIVGALCLGWAAAWPAWAADFASLSVDFLGQGADVLGLVARPGVAANAFWNPSGLAWFGAPSGTGFATYMDYLAGTRGGSAGYAWSARPGRGFGAYLSYLSSGEIPLTTWGDPVGGGTSFTYGELAGGLAAGGRIHRRLAVGCGLKLARENFDDVARSGAFFDLAATANLLGEHGGGGGRGFAAYLCAASRNIAIARWGTGDSKAPAAVEVGLAAASPGGASAGGSILVGRDGRREARLGVTALLSGQFEVRLGWRRRIGHASDAAYDFPWQRGLTAGFGVSLGKFWVDYTYEDASPLDAIHRFALRADIKPL